jgi:hypothetical protein
MQKKKKKKKKEWKRDFLPIFHVSEIPIKQSKNQHPRISHTLVSNSHTHRHKQFLAGKMKNKSNFYLN